MTKKRTTIYLDEFSQYVIDEVQENTLNLNQSEIIRLSLEQFYFSDFYKREKEKVLKFKSKNEKTK